MNKNKRFPEIATLILIYIIGLTSTMSLALEYRSPITLIAATSMENTMEKMHKQDRNDRTQNKEEVHDDKCYSYRKKLQDIELQLQGSDNINPRVADPTETSTRLSEGSQISELHREANILRQQIQQYCTY